MTHGISGPGMMLAIVGVIFMAAFPPIGLLLLIGSGLVFGQRHSRVKRYDRVQARKRADRAYRNDILFFKSFP